jgi:hypothetical protein
MKLTKGKIAKLYNKRKQTLKKKGKPKRITGKSKTFRQNRKVNLSRQSLRRFSRVGGRIPVNVSNRVLSVADTGLSTTNSLVSNVDQAVSEVPPVGPIGDARLGLTAAEMGVSGLQEGVSMAKSELPEPVAEPEQVTPVEPELPEQVAPSEPELPEQVTPVEPELPEQVTPSEPELPEQVTPSEPELPEQMAPAEPELQEQMAPAEPELPEQIDPSEPELPEQMAPSEPELPQPVTVEQTTPIIEPVTPPDEQNTKLNDAVKTIVDEITKQVEENLNSRIVQNDEIGQDDGFKAFTGAVDKLSNDTPAVEPEPKTGGKRRNTRRFKLVKNKTKRSAA